jgi:hypothetical protein
MDRFNTYTFTARNVENPDQVVTFTLYDEYLRVNLTGLVDQVEKITQAEKKQSEAVQQFKTQLKPVVMKVAENLSGPIHLSDVSATVYEDNLVLNGWRRAFGLRLSPFRLGFGRVDNPEAAQAFVSEMEARKGEISDQAALFGPMDYWFFWVGILIGAIFLIQGQRQKA